ncbi:MAG: lyase family protein, partial [Chloroflexota bacterium]
MANLDDARRGQNGPRPFGADEGPRTAGTPAAVRGAGAARGDDPFRDDGAAGAHSGGAGAHMVDSAFFRDQFGTAELRDIFGDRGLLQAWLETEAALARAEASVGLIPAAAAVAISRAARADSLDWAALKAGIDESFHPIVPVVRDLAHAADRIAAGAGGYVHWGATTQDIMDTAAVLQVRAALEAITPDRVAIEHALAGLAAEHADTLMAGRTHGQHALPITFGFKVAIWLAEW